MEEDSLVQMVLLVLKAALAIPVIRGLLVPKVAMGIPVHQGYLVLKDRVVQLAFPVHLVRQVDQETEVYQELTVNQVTRDHKVSRVFQDPWALLVHVALLANLVKMVLLVITVLLDHAGMLVKKVLKDQLALQVLLVHLVKEVLLDLLVHEASRDYQELLVIQGQLVKMVKLVCKVLLVYRELLV